MPDKDFHPADDLAHAFQGLFNGDNIKQTMRDAWDRVKGNVPDALKPAVPAQQMNWKPEPNAQQKQYLDEKDAAAIRAKARKATGGR